MKDSDYLSMFNSYHFLSLFPGELGILYLITFSTILLLGYDYPVVSGGGNTEYLVKTIA